MTYTAVLKSIDPERNRFREFRITAGPEPDGRFHVHTWRGRLGAPSLQHREVVAESVDEYVQELTSTVYTRVAHGYVPA